MMTAIAIEKRIKDAARYCNDCVGCRRSGAS